MEMKGKKGRRHMLKRREKKPRYSGAGPALKGPKWPLAAAAPPNTKRARA